MCNIQISKCAVDIRINDVPLYIDEIKGFDSSVVPINPYILKNGEQLLSVKVVPCDNAKSFDDNAELMLTITTFTMPDSDVYNELDQAIEKSEKIVAAFVLNDEFKKMPIVKVDGTFLADTSYILDAWQNSVDLTKIDDIRERLHDIYKRIKIYTDSGNYQDFFNMFQEHDKNTCISMYLDFTDKDINEQYANVLELFDEGYKLVIPEEKDNIMFFANGKLVTYRNTDGSSLLKLVNYDEKDEMELEMYFHMKQGSNELTII